ncbi:GTR11 protein, partial [Amia calva]|nr:GTR11 protein [Amia calva]
MLLTVVLGIGGSFQYGIQVSIMASPSEHIQNFVNQTWMARYGEPVSESTQKLIWSFIVSIFSLGGWLGAINSGTIPVIYGRKKCLLFNNVVAIVAAVLMGFSRMAGSFEMILLGRILYGYNVGLGLSVHLMYLGECSPIKLRGFLTLSSAIFIGLGKVMGQICGLREVMGTEPMWPYLLALSGLPAVVQFFSLLCFPETPRYLYIDKGDEEGCKKALKVLWGNVETKLELEDMTKERETMKGEKAKSVWDVLTSRSVRWQLLTLVIPCGLIQLCGISAIYFYAFDIFREAGVPKDQMHYLSIGIGTAELVTLILCSFLIDRTGRKWLMSFGYLAMAVLMGILVVMLSLQLFSSLPPAGITLTLPAELFLQAWRPSAYVISGTCNWVGLFLIGMFFPYVADAMGRFCFLIFVAYCVLSAVFMLVFIPETKGKTMVEIMEDFNKLNFKGRGVDTEKADLVLATKL